MTGRINYTPEAQQQLNDLDRWITTAASAGVARDFLSAILDHIDDILIFPLAGRARDDIRPGMRTTISKTKTVVAYAVERSPDGIVVNIVGVFHGGQEWEVALSEPTSPG